nr:mitogen-activated protein kinase 3-like [Tanacetum cinerariifolium]
MMVMWRKYGQKEILDAKYPKLKEPGKMDNTVEEALAHPYLERLHDDDDEPICPNPFCLDFEQQVAATLLLRWASTANKCNVIHSLCKVMGFS